MLRRPHVLFLAVLSLVAINAMPAHADWPAYGVPNSDAPASVGYARSAPDGSAGVYTAWDQFGSDYNVYIQRTDAHGNALYGSSAKVIAAFTNDQFLGDAVSDAAGNLFVLWLDARPPLSIRVQKIDPMGNLLWNPDGVVLATGAASYAATRLTADGSGGCVAAWADNRSGNLDVYVQRVVTAGTVNWTVNGIDLSSVAQTQTNPMIILADAGSVIVAWEDIRSGTNFDIYAQKVAGGGIPLWAANGVSVITSASQEQDVELIHNGAGGAILAFETATDVGGQHLNASGSRLWGTSGLLISGAGANSQYNPRIVSDGAGGAIVVWDDNRNPDGDIYAQRMSPTGGHMWDYLGVSVASHTADQLAPSPVSDGQGGTIITWHDDRSSQTGIDIYAQRMDGAGVRLWGSSGLAVVTANFNQHSPMLQPDGNGNAVVVYYDNRGFYGRAPAQRVEGLLGYWGYPEPDVYSVADTPGDQGGHVSVNWYRSERDQLGQNLITHYSVWRAIDALPFAANGPQAAALFVELSDITPETRGPVYRVEKTAAADYFWEYVGQQSAIYASGYSYNATTRFDSTSGDPADHTFQVVAHTYDAFTFWPSQPLGGHSVDNLAPAAPLMLSAERIGGDNVLLEWSQGTIVGDLADYVIYRAGAGGVTPIPGNFLTDATDTTAVDPTATASSPFWYIVTARDVHDNESDPSNEAMVNGGPTGVGDTPVPHALSLLGNAPNPFGSSTTWRVGLPSGADATLEVYDVAGRRVRRETRPLTAGWQTVMFDGRDGNGRALPSGVYFYRVSAAGQTRTAKMVVQR